jgi:hypothetical protein
MWQRSARQSCTKASKFWLEHTRCLPVLSFQSLTSYKITKCPCLNMCNQFQGWHVCNYIFVRGSAFVKPEGKFMGWDYRHLVAILWEGNLSKQLRVKFQPHVCLSCSDMQTEEPYDCGCHKVDIRLSTVGSDKFLSYWKIKNKKLCRSLFH